MPALDLQSVLDLQPVEPEVSPEPASARSAEYDYLAPLPPITAEQLSEDRTPLMQRPAIELLAPEEGFGAIPRIPAFGKEGSALRTASEFAGGLQESVLGGLSGMTSREGIATLPLFAVPVVGPGLALGLGAKTIGAGAGETVAGIEQEDPRLAGSGAGQIILGAPMIHGGVRGARPIILPRSLEALNKSGVEVPEFIQAKVQAGERAGVPVATEGEPQTFPKLELEPISEGGPSAVIDPQAAKVYEPVPPKPVEGKQAVPTEEGGLRVPTPEEAKPEVPLVQSPIRENGGQTSIVLKDGTAIVGGRFHGETWEAAEKLKAASLDDLANGVAAFTRPDGTTWDVQGKSVDVKRVVNLNDVAREASAGPKALAVGEPAKAGPTTRSGPPPAKAEEGALETATPSPVGEGPGAATPSEFGPERPFITSTKNAVTEAKRATRGMPEVQEEAAREWGTVWEDVKKQVEDDPGMGQRLVKELQSKPRPVSDSENALLLHEEIGLEDLYNKTVKRMLDAAETGGDTAIPELRLLLNEVSTQMQDLYDVTKSVGRETARGLNARKMMANQAYTLVRMQGAKRALKDGQPLTEAEAAEIKALHDKIKATQDAFDEHVRKSEGRIKELETQHAIDELKIAAAKEKKADAASGTERDIPGERADIIAGIGERASVPLRDLRPWIRKLALNFVRSGITERDTLINAVHDVLKEIIPTIERRQTMDAISGYGDFRPLDPEVSKAKLRDLSGQMQNVSKLEDLLARKALKKTGMERKVPSNEERRLTKLVNEYKKRYGVVVTDPAKQLKSALDAVKTRLTHQITDLDFQIKTGKKIVKGQTKIAYDAEAKALVERRDALKAQFDEIFGKKELTDEQRVAMAKDSLEKNIAELQRRITAGETVTPKTPSKTPLTAQLQFLRDQRDALKAQLQEMRDADVMLQESKAIKSLQDSIAEYERRLRENDLFREQSEGIKTPATEALRAQRNALAKELGERRAASPEADAKRIEQIQKDIAELERKIAAGELETKKTTRPVSSEESKYRKIREQTRLILQDLREKSGMYDADRIAKVTKSVDAAIEESIRQINEGDLAVKKTPARTTTPELEAKRAELKELQKIKQQLRNAAKPKKTPEEIALATLKTRLRNQTLDIQDKLLRGDFTPEVRKPVPLDPEAMRLKREMMLAKAKFQEALEIDRFNALSPTRKVFHYAGEGYDAVRTILTSFDLSALLRQGKFVVLSRPGVAAKAIPALFRSMASKEYAFRVDQEILARKNYPVYNQSGLYLAEHGKNLSRMEEVYMSKLADRIPGVAASQRAYTTFLNKLRADSFDALSNTLSQYKPVTPIESKAIANYINVATGRGNLGQLEQAGIALNRIFFSPRYVASRFQYLLGQPLYKGTARTRALIAGEYAKTLIGYAVFYTLAKLALPESTVETDPRSSDAGKIVIGNTRLDPLAGLQQNTVFLSRLGTGETMDLAGRATPIRGEDVPYGGAKVPDLIMRFLRSKLAPIPGAAVSVAAGENIIGEPVTVGSTIKDLTIPLAYQDILKAMEDQGVPRGIALSILSIFGEGVQVYD